MTIANFKSMIAAYVNRTAGSLTSVNGIDILLAAMNDARRAAQRDHNFELNRVEDAYLATHVGGANWQTGCKTTPGGATAILMKRIDEVWNYTTATVGATTYYPRTTRIDFSYTGAFKRELPTIDYRSIWPNTATLDNQFAYANGSTLFVTSSTTSTNYKLVGIKWLDDLADGGSEDIFLTYFTDWFKWATIAALNVYLKDSERFGIDAAVLHRSWESVKTYDGTIANMGESMTLD